MFCANIFFYTNKSILSVLVIISVKVEFYFVAILPKWLFIAIYLMNGLVPRENWTTLCTPHLCPLSPHLEKDCSVSTQASWQDMSQPFTRCSALLLEDTETLGHCNPNEPESPDTRSVQLYFPKAPQVTLIHCWLRAPRKACPGLPLAYFHTSTTTAASG